MPNELLANGKIGGLPKKIFDNQRFNGFMKGNSGNPLFIDLSPGSVRIWDMVWDCHFIASVDNGVLTIDAWTKGFEGTDRKHPDLYFGELLANAMDRFKANNVVIERVLCEWEADWQESRTSDIYWEFMSQLGESPSVNEMRNAAYNTSAGRIFRKFGFTKVDEVEIRKFLNKEKVVASFLKEDEAVAIVV